MVNNQICFHVALDGHHKCLIHIFAYPSKRLEYYCFLIKLIKYHMIAILTDCPIWESVLIAICIHIHIHRKRTRSYIFILVFLDGHWFRYLVFNLYDLEVRTPTIRKKENTKKILSNFCFLKSIKNEVEPPKFFYFSF